MKDRSEESNMAEEKHTHHHHEHDYEHGHHHHHHEDGPLKPGEHPDWRTHVHAPGEHHEVGVNDYMTAIAAYRKTFASKEDVLEQTPDPAVREMIKYLGQLGCDTVFDRFDQQKPQCTFGLAGVCCKNCNMGPCKITKKSPLGVCGADADVIVARNLLRSAAAGVAQHGAHAREILLSMKFVAEGRLKLPILGEKKLRTVSKAFGLETEGKSARELTGELADILLEDLSRAVPDDYKTIRVMAPKERQDVWDKLDIIPISAYNEVFDSYHRTAVGTDGDWESLMQEFLRCGLAFCFTGVVAANIGTDVLFGNGHRATSKVNIGALKEGWVNIAVHGHLPTLVSEIVRIGRTPEMIELAKAHGAKGIQFYGVCCSCLAAMYRYEGVIPLSNAVQSSCSARARSISGAPMCRMSTHPSCMWRAASRRPSSRRRRTPACRARSTTPTTIITRMSRTRRRLRARSSRVLSRALPHAATSLCTSRSTR